MWRDVRPRKSAGISGSYTGGAVPPRGENLYIGGYLFIGDPIDDQTTFIMLGTGADAGQQNAGNLSYDLLLGQFEITPLHGPTLATVKWAGLTQTVNLAGRTRIVF